MRALAPTLLLLACRASETPAPRALVDATPPPPAKSATVESAADAAPATRASTGPFEVPFLGARTVYYVAPHAVGSPQRLLSMLHGMCNPPAYACGLWADTAKDLGFLVCPTGNASCGKAMYDAPTWTEPDAKIDEDLEAAIAKVSSLHPGEIARDDAVLLGFSRGAYVAVKSAAAHPGRWPYLVLIEATPQLSAPSLRASKVRAVALMAGEIGSQLPGAKKSEASLRASGFPVKLWVMRKAGHHYSDDIADLMRQALTWVVAQPP